MNPISKSLNWLSVTAVLIFFTGAVFMWRAVA